MMPASARQSVSRRRRCQAGSRRARPLDRLPVGWTDAGRLGRRTGCRPTGPTGFDPLFLGATGAHWPRPARQQRHMRFPLATLCHVWSACDIGSRQARGGWRSGRAGGRRGVGGSGGAGEGAGSAAGVDHRAEAARQRQSRIGTPLKWRSCGAERPIGKAGAQGGLHRGSRNAETGDLPRFGRLRLSRGHSTIFRAGRGPDTGQSEAARGSRFGKALLNECQWVTLTVSHGDAVRFGRANNTVHREAGCRVRHGRSRRPGGVRGAGVVCGRRSPMQ